jgi:hypothetical protein
MQIALRRSTIEFLPEARAVYIQFPGKTIWVRWNDDTYLPPREHRIWTKEIDQTTGTRNVWILKLHIVWS